jgi:hypothetical protein
MTSTMRVSVSLIPVLAIACITSLVFAQQPPKVRLPQASPAATVSQTIGITMFRSLITPVGSRTHAVGRHSFRQDCRAHQSKRRGARR